MFIGPMIVLLDCVMTFFGSSANDAAFNAYVTDVTDDTNRGKVESVIAILPLVAMLIIFGLFEGMIAAGQWNVFYYIFGGLVLLVGVGLIFLMPKDTNKPNTKENYFKNIFYGFRPSTIKHNPMLYIVLIAFALFSMGIQTFYPYFIIYIQEGLQIKEMNFVLVMGGVLLTACIVTVVFGLFMDKIGTNKVLIPSIVVTGIGALLMFFAKHVAFMVPAGILMMSGLMISQAAFGAKIRQYTPEEETGLFQGIRMMFSVLLPMVTGPFIGEWLYELTSDGTYTNEFNQVVTIPNEYIFLGAAIIIIISIIPVILIVRKELKNAK
jgi:MFS family permease